MVPVIFATAVARADGRRCTDSIAALLTIKNKNKEQSTEKKKRKKITKEEEEEEERARKRRKSLQLLTTTFRLFSALFVYLVVKATFPGICSSVYYGALLYPLKNEPGRTFHEFSIKVNGK